MSEIVKQMQIKHSNIPKRYLIDKKLIPSVQDTNNFLKLKTICDNVKAFVKDGHNLLIYSNRVGNGKTSWSCKIALAYINSYACNFSINSPVLFINAAEYINKRKAAISDATLAGEVKDLEAKLYKADLVIWDDIATKALSEFDMEQLYVFINNRVSNMKSNIFTSNSNTTEMSAIMGARLSSRIVNSSIQIELVGSDKREDIFNFDSASST